MGAWQPIATAPRDGTPILGVYDNDCAWEYRLVRWCIDDPDPDYPWQCIDAPDNSWAEHRIHYWTPLPEPPQADNS